MAAGRSRLPRRAVVRLQTGSPTPYPPGPPRDRHVSGTVPERGSGAVPAWRRSQYAHRRFRPRGWAFPDRAAGTSCAPLPSSRPDASARAPLPDPGLRAASGSRPGAAAGPPPPPSTSRPTAGSAWQVPGSFRSPDCRRLELDAWHLSACLMGASDRCVTCPPCPPPSYRPAFATALLPGTFRRSRSAFLPCTSYRHRAASGVSGVWHRVPRRPRLDASEPCRGLGAGDRLGAGPRLPSLVSPALSGARLRADSVPGTGHFLGQLGSCVTRWCSSPSWSPAPPARPIPTRWSQPDRVPGTAVLPPDPGPSGPPPPQPDQVPGTATHPQPGRVPGTAPPPPTRPVPGTAPHPSQNRVPGTASLPPPS
jgi:hypothetical protein